jgi:hypothetical protein
MGFMLALVLMLETSQGFNMQVNCACMQVSKPDSKAAQQQTHTLVASSAHVFDACCSISSADFRS